MHTQFESSNKAVKDELLEISSRILPVKLFIPKSSTFKRESPERSSGMWPIKAFNSSSRTSTSEQFPSSGGCRKAMSSYVECRATVVTGVAGVYGDSTVQPAMESWSLKNKIKIHR
jgi:hypothetical protein